jgi:hypothetical protein
MFQTDLVFDGVAEGIPAVCVAVGVNVGAADRVAERDGLADLD